MRAAGDVGAVNETEDCLVRASALTEVRVEVHATGISGRCHAVQRKVHGMAEHRHDRLERFCGALQAARHVDHQRLAALPCKSTRKGGHRGADETDAPHLFGNPRHLVFDEQRRRLWRYVPRAEPCPACGDDDGGTALVTTAVSIASAIRSISSGTTSGSPVSNPPLLNRLTRPEAALVFAMAAKYSVADRDHVGFAQRAWISPRLSSTSRYVHRDFSSNLTDSIDTPQHRCPWSCR